jgi:hypothetical protein
MPSLGSRILTTATRDCSSCGIGMKRYTRTCMAKASECHNLLFWFPWHHSNSVTAAPWRQALEYLLTKTDHVIIPFTNPKYKNYMVRPTLFLVGLLPCEEINSDYILVAHNAQRMLLHKSHFFLFLWCLNMRANEMLRRRMKKRRQLLRRFSLLIDLVFVRRTIGLGAFWTGET